MIRLSANLDPLAFYFQPCNETAIDISTNGIQLLPEDEGTKMMTINEKNGGTVNPNWIFEIFHGDFVNGIRQKKEDSSGNYKTTEIGSVEGEKETIILSDDEYVTKVEFLGLDL